MAENNRLQQIANLVDFRTQVLNVSRHGGTFDTRCFGPESKPATVIHDAQPVASRQEVREALRRVLLEHARRLLTETDRQLCDLGIDPEA